MSNNEQAQKSRLNAALDLLIAYLLEQSDLNFENEPLVSMTQPKGGYQLHQTLNLFSSDRGKNLYN